MINKIVIKYLEFREWLHLHDKGCLKGHDFEYIVTQYEGKPMFFEHCTRCKYTEGSLG